MTIVEGLRTFLLQEAGIAAIVLNTHIYPLRLPQKIDLKTAGTGAVVLTRISETGSAHLRGPDALVRARIQLDAWALTYLDAVALATRCRQRLDGYQGTWTDASSPTTSLQIQAVLAEVERDEFDEDILGGFCRSSTDYFVFYQALNESILIT